MFSVFKKSEEVVSVIENQNLNYLKDRGNQDLKHCLISYLKGFSVHNRNLSAKTRELSRALHKNSSYFQSELAKNKWFSRHYLLAYGFLSGKEYKSIERKCAKNNKPAAYIIFNIIKGACEMNGGKFYIKEDLRSLQSIEKWIAGEGK
jgi:hypothetical protein